MNKDFSRTLALLRKEKGISQKQVASDLGISQALLSHYEKGIRECGLDFLARCSKYYGVTTDYLLGLSPDKQGAPVQFEEIPDPEANGKQNVGMGSLVPTLNKKLLFNSLNVIYDLLGQCGDTELTQEISDYLMGATYRAFRVLYSGSGKNPEEIFKTPRSMMQSFSTAAMEVHIGMAEESLNQKKIPGFSYTKNREKLEIFPKTIMERYPLFGSSLLNVIQRVESQMEGFTPKPQKRKKGGKS